MDNLNFPMGICLNKSKSFQKKYCETKNHKYSLQIFGSNINGLASNESSDLDLTILISDYNISHKILLWDVMSVLKKYQDGKDRYKFQQGMPRKDKSGFILQFHDNELNINMIFFIKGVNMQESKYCNKMFYYFEQFIFK